MKHILDRFVSTSGLTAAELKLQMPYNLFRELLESCEKKLTSDEYMEALYFHSLIEKAVSFLKNREFNSADFIKEKLVKIDRGALHVDIRSGAECCYLACAAYEDYAKQHLSGAEDKIRNSFTHAITQHQTMPLFLTNLYEQNINLMRIFIKARREQEIITQVNALLNSLLFNQNNGAFFHQALVRLGEVEKTTWLHYVLDSFFVALSAGYREDAETQKRIFISIMKNVFDKAVEHETQNRHIINCFHIIHSYLTNDLTGYENYFDIHFESLQYSPTLLKRMILGSCVEWCEKHDSETINHPNYPNFVTILTQYNMGYQGHIQEAAA
jgi:hypothetical protein